MFPFVVFFSYLVIYAFVLWMLYLKARLDGHTGEYEHLSLVLIAISSLFPLWYVAGSAPLVGKIFLLIFAFAVLAVLPFPTFAIMNMMTIKREHEGKVKERVAIIWEEDDVERDEYDEIEDWKTKRVRGWRFAKMSLASIREELGITPVLKASLHRDGKSVILKGEYHARPGDTLEFSHPVSFA